MPKQKRWQIKRKFDKAASNLNRAEDDIAELGAEFHGVHPEHYEGLSRILSNIEQCRLAVLMMKDII